MGVCCCLQTCTSAVNILVMWLVLGPSLMVIYEKYPVIIAKVSSLYNVLQEWLCCCLQVNYRVVSYRTVIIAESKSLNVNF